VFSLKRQAAVWGMSIVLLAAGPPWHSKTPDQWSATDIEQILSNSPWAQSGNATFPETQDEGPASAYSLPGAPQAGMAGPKAGATDGRWDGGVGRNTGRGLLPTLPILVRWESSLPVRQAQARSLAAAGNPSSKPDAPKPDEPQSYIISVSGLLPAGRYRSTGQLAPKSSSSEPGRSVRDPEQLLEGLMANSKLRVPGKVPIAASDLKLEAETGLVRVYFPRQEAIKEADKEVTFVTRFGSLSVAKKFRLGDMKYHGRLEL
jgi:hypothetical protein